MSILAYLKTALSLTDEIRSIIEKAQHAGFSKEIKNDKSLVTSVDRDAEKHFRSRIIEAFPTHGILGEEFGVHQPDAEYRWVIDPIDGTEDFARGIPTFGTIVGLFHAHIPILGIIDFPALGTRYHALKGEGAFRDGTRIHLEDFAPDHVFDGSELVHISPKCNFLRHGAEGALYDYYTNLAPRHRVFHTCLSHGYTADGTLDATIEWNLRIWDLAAAQILIQEAGGEFHYVKRTSDKHGEILSAIFGKPRLVQRLLASE
jgi:histidinol-phosphatase